MEPKNLQKFSIPSLMRPTLLQLKSGLIREVASLYLVI